MPSTTATLANEYSSAYIEKSFLERAKTDIKYAAGATVKQMPGNSGKTVQFVRYTPLGATPSDVIVTDEITSNEVNMTDTAITATVSLYSSFVKLSEFYDLTTETGANGLLEHIDVLAQNMGETIDNIIRDELAGGGTTSFANGVAAATDVAASDTLDGADVRKAFSDLAIAKAPRFALGSGFTGYRAIAPVAVIHDLRGSSEWLDANTYVDTTLYKNGTLGMLHGVEFVETNNQVIEADAGASAVDLYTTFFVGKESYGTIDLANQPVGMFADGGQVSVHRPDNSSTDNPAGLFMTASWKAYFVAKVLNSSWVLEVKSASSIGAN